MSVDDCAWGWRATLGGAVNDDRSGSGIGWGYLLQPPTVPHLYRLLVVDDVRRDGLVTVTINVQAVPDPP